MVSTVRLSLSCEYPGPSPGSKRSCTGDSLRSGLAPSSRRSRTSLRPQLRNLEHPRRSSGILEHSRTSSPGYSPILSSTLPATPPCTFHHSCMHFHRSSTHFHRSSIGLPSLFHRSSVPPHCLWLSYGTESSQRPFASPLRSSFIDLACTSTHIRRSSIALHRPTSVVGDYASS